MKRINYHRLGYFRQTSATKIGIGRCALHNFHQKRSSAKNFNDKNFAIYGMCLKNMHACALYYGVLHDINQHVKFCA